MDVAGVAIAYPCQVGNDSAAPSANSSSSDSSTWSVAVVVATLTGVFTLAAALGGTLLAGRTTEDSVEDQIDASVRVAALTAEEGVEARLRSERKIAYAEFLELSERYLALAFDYTSSAGGAKQGSRLLSSLQSERREIEVSYITVEMLATTPSKIPAQSIRRLAKKLLYGLKKFDSIDDQSRERAVSRLKKLRCNRKLFLSEIRSELEIRDGSRLFFPGSAFIAEMSRSEVSEC